MVNVSGHLLSTAEVESALIEHEDVAEAASVAQPHKIKGECIYCFVTLKEVCVLVSMCLFVLCECVCLSVCLFFCKQIHCSFC